MYIFPSYKEAVKAKYKMKCSTVHVSPCTSVILFLFSGLCISSCTLAHTNIQNTQIGRQMEAGKMMVLGRH